MKQCLSVIFLTVSRYMNHFFKTYLIERQYTETVVVEIRKYAEL